MKDEILNKIQSRVIFYKSVLQRKVSVIILGELYYKALLREIDAEKYNPKNGEVKIMGIPVFKTDLIEPTYINIF